MPEARGLKEEVSAPIAAEMPSDKASPHPGRDPDRIGVAQAKSTSGSGTMSLTTATSTKTTREHRHPASSSS